MTPTLIVTRPDPQGAAFAAAVQRAWGGDLHVILSPLLQILSVPVAHDLSDLSGVIFTSFNGVAQAERLRLRTDIPAFCVGDRTAEAARDLGFETITSPGDAAQLTALIMSKRPIGHLAHIRGRHARGNIAPTLARAGIPCRDIIAYDQQVLPLTAQAQTALAGQNPVVVPLFSPRTGAIFAQSRPFEAPLHVVAISGAVLPPGLPAQTTQVAATPDGSAMIAATLACLRALKQPQG